MTVAVLAPGYGGTAEQSVLRRLAGRLEQVGIASARVTFSTRGRRPSRGYEVELEDLRAARERLLAEHGQPAVLVGRSFGGRMCAFLAEREPPAGLVVLGHPIAPPGRPRPRDEAALLAMSCPTLIVQGDRDELGPLALLERIAASNPRVELSVLPGAGHDLGGLEAEAVERAVAWIVERVHSA
jgi:hypothetical protein